MLDIVTDRTYRSERDCDVDCRLLEESGLLDVTSYCASAGLEAGAHAARHYLVAGLACGSRAEPRISRAVSCIRITEAPDSMGLRP